MEVGNHHRRLKSTEVVTQLKKRLMEECGGRQHEGVIGQVLLKLLNTQAGKVEDL